ncbi:hypothetical protein [Paenirhodobacter sp. CAU 1674]|uniref:spike base protein, RCAP_Rcc01079 family n=1 Tax=Paenirhodobacter sp. CAU 1674 TaxID=3032596 RepID=UPI0023DCB1A0|nr:hypothetical protein [Paenirhodobacter sp. CAU 1674]MDF2140866.1 hypothetical protein [Paenirhodobacter sp. CAU 1674]
MADKFKNHPESLESPASRMHLITPNDDADLPVIPRALWVQASGDLAIRDAAGTEVVIYVIQGAFIPIRVVRVLATGTTATVIGLE